MLNLSDIGMTYFRLPLKPFKDNPKQRFFYFLFYHLFIVVNNIHVTEPNISRRDETQRYVVHIPKILP